MIQHLLWAWRRHAQKRELRREQGDTAPEAYENARELCAVIGPWDIATEYAIDDTSLPEIAWGFARAAYHDHPEVQQSAMEGALAGFWDWLEPDRTVIKSAGPGLRQS